MSRLREIAIDAFMKELRGYDFFDHWDDDMLYRQAEFAYEAKLSRVAYMRLMLFAAGEWMKANAHAITPLIAALNGVLHSPAITDDFPF